MNSTENLETFLYLGKNKVSISAFKDKDNQIFKKNLIFEINELNINQKIDDFIEKSIFEIEKLSHFFVKQINFISDNENFLVINVSIKETKNNFKITKEGIEYLIFDLKKIIQQNNKDYTITKIRINNFKINNQLYKSFDQINFGEIVCLEVMFECIKKEFQKKIKSKLSKVEVDIKKYLSSNSLVSEDQKQKLDICEAAIKMTYEHDQNEVHLVSKNTSKKSIFEKFFDFI